MNNAPIGVLDSGFGGMSVLRELVRKLPQENFLYVADSGHCPYGGKSQQQIIARATTITDFLLGRACKQVVVACNTATIAAVEYLRANYSNGFVGMEPAVKPAVAQTRSGVVGVLATVATLSGEKLHKLIDRHAGSVRIITQPCPGLPERVEAGDLDGPQTQSLIERYTAPLLAGGADVIVLGSTHYPFLRPLIQRVVGPGIVLLDTGEAVARRAASLLTSNGEDLRADRDEPGGVEWYTSGTVPHMESIGSRLWGLPIAASLLPT